MAEPVTIDRVRCANRCGLYVQTSGAGGKANCWWCARDPQTAADRALRASRPRLDSGGDEHAVWVPDTAELPASRRDEPRDPFRLFA